MDAKGFFLPNEWSYTINEDLVGGTTLSEDDAAEVTNTTLHESRHAEQEFLAARHAAGVEKKDAASIVKKHEIPKEIAAKAVEKKIDAKTDPATAKLGQDMYQASVTDKDTNQKTSDDTQKAIDALKTKNAAAAVALRKLERSATAENISEAKKARNALQAQILVVEKAYSRYRQIPYEADAHDVGFGPAEIGRGWPMAKVMEQEMRTKKPGHGDLFPDANPIR